ncbi:xanthine dehydrogenase [Bacillus sp. DNRA2]|uniref:FAD binding domain-containing protein n=1 Tax=Bacillus sp. DNRA2 TaxID=2723053 RepID=UPI00145CB527|nr:FAD binding domain-containing protein [Bacillus sp. DNRA2]NMD69833.1 xanthine dehydrogenase [Bacillus sp. DNRA2]
MLSGNIEYFKPTTVMEAVNQYQKLSKEKKHPIYYGGGTEILTLGRIMPLNSHAVIDIKGINETLMCTMKQEQLIIGAGLSLTEIEEKNVFPLLTETSKEIADHTARNKITIGGNICGQIFYREAVLPFLLCDSEVVIAGLNGIKTIGINQLFKKTLRLEDGQFLLQILTDTEYLSLPYVSIKKRQQWYTGYPLLTIAAIKSRRELRFAFSGLCNFPFRSKQMEKVLNNSSLTVNERIAQSLLFLPKQILNDLEGSKEFRLFVLSNTLKEIMMELEEK